ncbi:MAG: heme-binding domain-containing protein [Myxococcaceae bacterium]
MKRVLWALAFAFVGIQFVPFGRNHTNPPVLQDSAWNSPKTRELAARACFDCHSNQTRWPWYSHVAPISWMVRHHVNEGREHLNFSEAGRTYKDADEAGEVVREGEMPLPPYLLVHPEARLSPEEKRLLAEGLEAMFGKR